MLVDDYDLVSTSRGNPLRALVPYLAQASDLGLHVVVARRTGGASRAMYDPVLQTFHDLGMTGILLSGDSNEGQLIGIHSKDNDLTVNAIKTKPLTNMRASGTDEAIVLTTPIKKTLEQALEFIDDDELVEVTPLSVRIRKKLLTEMDRKRYNRSAGKED